MNDKVTCTIETPNQLLDRMVGPESPIGPTKRFHPEDLDYLRPAVYILFGGGPGNGNKPMASAEVATRAEWYIRGARRFMRIEK